MSEDARVPLPPAVAERIDAALAAMRAHPQHHLTPHLHRAIYAAFGPWSDPPACRAQAWLAILAAEHVLPIYRAEWPREITPRPEDLITVARRLAEGALTREAGEVTEALEHGYHAYGHLWVLDIPDNVYLAVSAAYDALCEACALSEPLSDLTSVYLFAPHGQGLRGDAWSDEELAGSGSADAASSAAIALACSPQNTPTDARKLRAFWEWWLTEAIPQAWRRASAGDGPAGVTRPME
jgi:hypothetical protein